MSDRRAYTKALRTNITDRRSIRAGRNKAVADFWSDPFGNMKSNLQNSTASTARTYQNAIGGNLREASALRKRGMPARVRPKTEAVGRKTKGARWARGHGTRKLDPVNWKTRTRVLGGIGAIGLGVGIGTHGGLSSKRYPTLESSNVSFHKPAQRRMNFSTAGLTQSLHNRANRLVM